MKKSKVLFKTLDGVNKRVGDAYYVIQDGSKNTHHYPLEIQLVKIENSTDGTSRNYYDSRLSLDDSGVFRFHKKKVAKSYLKYLKTLNK